MRRPGVRIPSRPPFPCGSGPFEDHIEGLKTPGCPIQRVLENDFVVVRSAGDPYWSMPSLSNFETSGAVGVSAHPPGTSFAPHLQRYFRVSSDTPFAPAKLASKTMPRVLG